MSQPREQLRSIHAMLAAGQRCVELERHSLLLWGLVGGGLCALTDLAISPERFPETGQRALALLAWLGGWLGATAALDHRLTRRARSVRDETVPFAQAQVTRAWWMLLALGALGSFAMFFHGGGSMIYALWTVLLGLGIFIFGLFARPLIEWIGIAAILLGASGLAAGLPLDTARWLTASTFAVGVPLAGWLALRARDDAAWARALAVAVWLGAVAAPPLLAARLVQGTLAPAGDTQTLTLSAGKTIPLRFDMSSPLVELSAQQTFPVRVLRDTEIALMEGQPDGRYRIAGGPWRSYRDGALVLRIDRIAPMIADGRPEIRVHGWVTLQGEHR